MKLVVIEKKSIAINVVKLRLAAPDNSLLPEFKPGAHIEIAIAGFKRRYSLTSSPNCPECYEICVLRTENSRGGSAYIHVQLGVGDLVDASYPLNAFPLNLHAEESIFIAGGIGITPFVSMMEALGQARKSFELHYAARTRDHFLPLPKNNDKTFLYTDKNGVASLNIVNLLRGLDRNAHIYVCGPRSLIEAVRTTARNLGWSSQAIHFESFGAQPKHDDKPVIVNLVQSGMTIEARPGTSILDALLENDVWASYECLRGECASCVVEVLSGDIDHRDVCLRV